MSMHRPNDKLSILLTEMTKIMQDMEKISHKKQMHVGLVSRIHTSLTSEKEAMAVKSPFECMDDCRNALNLLDKKGWSRSFHQRQFHDDFLKACTRCFWKLQPPGSFARDHVSVLKRNGWDHLAQEILISTPRR
jgi:hypothetical protein